MMLPNLPLCPLTRAVREALGVEGRLQITESAADLPTLMAALWATPGCEVLVCLYHARGNHFLPPLARGLFDAPTLH